MSERIGQREAMIRAREMTIGSNMRWVFIHDDDGRCPLRFEAYRGGRKWHGYHVDPDAFLADVESVLASTR